MADAQLPFAFDAPDGPPQEVLPEALVRDADARVYAVDPSVNVALEASAGTGKTKVRRQFGGGCIIKGTGARAGGLHDAVVESAARHQCG